MKAKTKVAICVVLLIFSFALLAIQFKKHKRSFVQYVAPYILEKQREIAMKKKAPEEKRIPEEPVWGVALKKYKNQNIDNFRKAFCGSGKKELQPYYKKNDGLWQKNERLNNQKILNYKKYDYIVLPVQDFSQGNDMIGRLLSAEYIAKKITLATGAAVMPPELVLRLLGERMYVYDDKEVYNLANMIGAKVVHLFLVNDKVAKNEEGFHTQELAVVLTGSAGTVKEYKVYKVKYFTTTETLDVKVSDISDDIAQTLTGRKPLPADRIFNEAGNWQLRGTVDDIIANLKTPVDHAAYFQLLALLSPHLIPDERTYLFERSLVILQEIDQRSTYCKLLKARALYYLHRRPQALDLLEGEIDPASTALHEFLNGNYYSFKELLPKIVNPLLYTLSFIEFAELSQEYQKKLPEYNPGMSDKHWKILVERSIHDNETWDRIDRRALLSAMGEIFPGFKQSMTEEMNSRMMINSLLEEESGGELISKLIQKSGEMRASAPSRPYEDTVESADFWNMYRNIIINLPFRQLKEKVVAQGIFKIAVEYGEKLAPILDGLPGFNYMHAQGLYGLAEKTPAGEANYYLKKVFDLTCGIKQNSFRYEYYELGAYWIINKMKSYGEKNGLECPETDFMQLSSHFPSDQIFANSPPNFLAKALPYTITSFKLLEEAHKRSYIDQQTFEREFATRFDGSPEKLEYTVRNLKKEGKKEEAVSVLRNVIQKGAQEWWIYNLLGKSLLEMSDYAGAREAFLSFPDFFNVPPGESVAVSNYADDVGNEFYRLGKFDEASEFFRLCVSYGTGAGAEDSANYRLSLLKKDYLQATYYASHCWKRYNNMGALSNYLSNKSMLEPINDLQPVFVELLSRYQDEKDSSYLWTPIFISHRIQSSDQDNTVPRLQDLLLKVPSLNKSQAYEYIFLQRFIDRELQQNYLEEIKQFSWQKLYFKTLPKSQFGNIFFSQNCSDSQKHCGKRVQIPSDMSANDLNTNFYLGNYFLQEKEYEKAADIFLYLDASKPMLDTKSGGAFALPSAVMAMLKSPDSNKEMFGRLLQEISPKEHADPDFQTKLTLALLYANNGETERSLQTLEQAEFQGPVSDWHRQYSGGAFQSPLFLWYQILSEAEWLYKFTGEKKFLELGLNVSKRLQISDPQFGFAYAFEALYGPDQKSRIRAAGYAYYFDKQSNWLSHVPDKILQQGKKWLKNNEPFSLKTTGEMSKNPKKIDI